MRYWCSLVCLMLPAAWGAAPKPLAIERLVISQFEDGPAIPGNYAFYPGDTVFFSFHVSGYKSVGDDEPRLSLVYTIEAQDPDKIPLMEAQSGKVDTTLDTEDKDWKPKVRLEVAVPPFAPSGAYQVQVTLEDRVAQSRTSAHLSFTVKGRAVEPSDTLVVRAFHFYRGEDDQQPLVSPVYRGGDSVWARFEITGYKLGPKNAFDVGYGVQLLRPNGESLFRQEDGATEKQAPFYPQRYVPAALSLNLDKDIKPGQYTMVVLVSDRVGGRKVESAQTFTVE